AIAPFWARLVVLAVDRDVAGGTPDRSRGLGQRHHLGRPASWSTSIAGEVLSLWSLMSQGSDRARMSRYLPMPARLHCDPDFGRQPCRLPGLHLGPASAC